MSEEVCVQCGSEDHPCWCGHLVVVGQDPTYDEQRAQIAALKIRIAGLELALAACADVREARLAEARESARNDRERPPSEPPSAMSARDRLNLELIARQGRTLGEKPWDRPDPDVREARRKAGES